MAYKRCIMMDIRNKWKKVAAASSALTVAGGLTLAATNEQVRSWLWEQLDDQGMVSAFPGYGGQIDRRSDTAITGYEQVKSIQTVAFPYSSQALDAYNNTTLRPKPEEGYTLPDPNYNKFLMAHYTTGINCTNADTAVKFDCLKDADQGIWYEIDGRTPPLQNLYYASGADRSLKIVTIDGQLYAGSGKAFVECDGVDDTLTTFLPRNIGPTDSAAIILVTKKPANPVNSGTNGNILFSLDDTDQGNVFDNAQAVKFRIQDNTSSNLLYRGYIPGLNGQPVLSTNRINVDDLDADKAEVHMMYAYGGDNAPAGYFLDGYSVQSSISTNTGVIPLNNNKVSICGAEPGRESNTRISDIYIFKQAADGTPVPADVVLKTALTEQRLGHVRQGLNIGWTYNGDSPDLTQDERDRCGASPFEGDPWCRVKSEHGVALDGSGNVAPFLTVNYWSPVLGGNVLNGQTKENKSALPFNRNLADSYNMWGYPILPSVDLFSKSTMPLILGNFSFYDGDNGVWKNAANPASAIPDMAQDPQGAKLPYAKGGDGLTTLNCDGTGALVSDGTAIELKEGETFLVEFDAQLTDVNPVAGSTAKKALFTIGQYNSGTDRPLVQISADGKGNVYDSSLGGSSIGVNVGNQPFKLAVEFKYNSSLGWRRDMYVIQGGHVNDDYMNQPTAASRVNSDRHVYLCNDGQGRMNFGKGHIYGVMVTPDVASYTGVSPMQALFKIIGSAEANHQDPNGSLPQFNEKMSGATQGVMSLLQFYNQ